MRAHYYAKRRKNVWPRTNWSSRRTSDCPCVTMTNQRIRRRPGTVQTPCHTHTHAANNNSRSASPPAWDTACCLQQEKRPPPRISFSTPLPPPPLSHEHSKLASACTHLSLPGLDKPQNVTHPERDCHFFLTPLPLAPANPVLPPLRPSLPPAPSPPRLFVPYPFGRDIEE